MRRHRTILGGAVALAAIAALAACEPGDGSTLDAYGRSREHPYAPSLGSRYGAASFPPTFSGIRQGFFDAFCVECHAGGSAPKGLDLSDEDAYGRLVNRTSAERPDLLLVDPGNPGASYLVVKLEGGPGLVGRQMPRDRPARPQEEIDVIRLWIQDGAGND